MLRERRPLQLANQLRASSFQGAVNAEMFTSAQKRTWTGVLDPYTTNEQDLKSAKLSNGTNHPISCQTRTFSMFFQPRVIMPFVPSVPLLQFTLGRQTESASGTDADENRPKS